MLTRHQRLGLSADGLVWFSVPLNRAEFPACLILLDPITQAVLSEKYNCSWRNLSLCKVTHLVSVPIIMLEVSHCEGTRGWVIPGNTLYLTSFSALDYEVT
jgi:hypothetical protein